MGRAHLKYLPVCSMIALMTAVTNPGLAEVRKIAAGDQQALSQLYRQYSSMMMALGVRILRSRKEAEDILHDVFLEVWKRAGSYDPERGTVKTWLMLRMRCRCLDRVNSAGFSRSTSYESAGLEEITTIGTKLQKRADAARLRKAFSVLPPDQALVLLLGYFEGLSSSEIADKLGVPLGTVKSRVASAMAKLRSHLEPEMGEPS
jgi:RNA polymerase sigma-70 factor (ECF subfamily)